MKTEVELPFEESADRIELFVRLLYFFVVGIIMCILGCLAFYIGLPLQFLAVLILGKRIEILNRIIAAYARYTISWYPYLMNLTDEKPDLMPKF